MAVNDKMGLPRGSWRDFWCSEDSEVYQFIGQDNLYFYGVAQPALIEALRPGDILTPGETDHPIAPNEAGGEPPYSAGEQEGLVVGRGEAAYGRRAA